MGIAGAQHQCRTVDLEDLRRISERTPMHRKDSDDFYGRRVLSNSSSDTDEEPGDELVCVTSGVSLLGLALVNQLLQRGFSVRILLDNPDDAEDGEKVREMKLKSEAGGGVSRISTLSADLTESHSLVNAFEGCRGVFHTSSFIDPSGLTGYSKAMVEVEKKVSENVMEACARTSSVRYCVFTSSLLACIWRDGTRAELPPVVDHDCWSDRSLCNDKKLWYALGKLKAEKAAWRIAKERDIKLVTICSALVTPPPNLSTTNSTPTIAYLKGAEEMYEQGLLATVSVRRLAEAQVNVYEAMGENEAHGRYICFDQIIKTGAEAEALAREICIPITKICQSQEEEASTSTSSKFQLSNKRLFNLTSSRAPSTRCYSLNAFP
ncbi:cinnamoyl-CoA reductase 1-like isoform X1 [Cucumis melo var. makuwa]|uniref:Cinnamoyl-CoA reductase 1-like isoform X1 n=2 Tax=Cucumis melo TaxID=3656 RepID=A0A5D3BM33_CUCMM|nr:cinnamoyl-CoA reductase 1-like isoform X1 [Cucumis melo var. makuwa]TYK00833.1 cinnamoyl-CoA reductase 1-like isoform X1 [Cucumis melo var. makuwa]